MIGGRYELGHEIGRGGMGAVWVAHDTVLGRDVAVKQIGMSAGGATPDLERAEREAHLAARINHQNVVAVFDLVDEDGYQWLVMEHVDGPTLADLITERGHLSPDELTPIAEQVALALAAAHAHGIVHRDVKPSNILLTQAGVAKLSDFGVARAQADASLTQTGMVTGSPAYLSPEVASGRPATGASDVWSLGATLFHALNGQPPYAVGDNVLGAMYRIVNEEPPRLDSDDELATLVTSMMQRDPDARPTMAWIEERAATRSVHDVPRNLEATQGFAAFADTTEPAEPTATTAFRPLAPPVAEATEPAHAASDVPAPAAPAATAGEPASRADRSRTALIVLAGLAAVAALVFVLNLGGDDDGGPVAGPPTSTSEPAATASPSPSPSPSVDPAEADDAALEGFVTDYLQTASSDPDTGFTMLTPKFQAESDGLDGYKGFWDGVSDLDVQQVDADAADLRVSYTYSYEREGESRTDSVTLQLVRSGDTFLIDGEA
ncbi:serine/threonine protein kinase [Aeromicrobium sp. CFBP 8757]|uniref:serine/threonine-protein kinase n=1 Tax=Aeromicrobium sp. CFBP 8757 TaxID=2775288 RepID=UPI001786F870|nr:serine/threonine-protein kinase [Aeromicrobium sp. CFBP 8757]MBD8606354.1 serine/threonine protein kinase [Aeromicrobium sp. CFBP 8757]